MTHPSQTQAAFMKYRANAVPVCTRDSDRAPPPLVPPPTNGNSRKILILRLHALSEDDGTRTRNLRLDRPAL
jgi:hypothetical protein